MAKKESEVLSQNEIDQLLGVMAESEEKKWEKVGDGNGGTRRVKRVEHAAEGFFSERQKKQVESLFSDAMQNLIEHVSIETRNLSHFHVSSVDELTYEEFTRSIPTPAAIARADWGEERMVIEVDPWIVPYLLYSDTVELLQTERDNFDDDSAEFQTIEDVIGNILRHAFRDYSKRELKKLSEVLFEPLLRFFSESFRKHAGSFPLRGTAARTEIPAWSVSALETNPQFAYGASGSEACLEVMIEAKIGEEEGFVNVCLPAPFVRTVLVGCGLIEDFRGSGDAEGQKPLSERNALAVLDGIDIPLGATLKTGDIIDLPHASLSAITLCDKAGAEIAQAELVRVDDHLGLRITGKNQEKQED